MDGSAITSGAGSFAGIVTSLGAAGMAILGNEVARGNAEEAIRRAAEIWNIPLPDLQAFVAETMGPSAMEGVYSDPSLAAAQTDSLAQLKDISDSGGMTTEDRVNNEMLQRDAAQRAQAQRQSIVNVIGRSGQAAGPVSAALQLGAQRDQQEAGALAGARTAGDARRRAIEAVLARGKMAGDVRSQGFGEAAQRATAADRIAQYNAGAKERAQRYNINRNQQQFDNERSLAAGRSGVQMAGAAQQTAGAAASGQRLSDLGTGIAQAIPGVVDMVNGGKGGGSDPGFTSAPVPMSGKVKEDEEEDGIRWRY